MDSIKENKEFIQSPPKWSKSVHAPKEKEQQPNKTLLAPHREGVVYMSGAHKEKEYLTVIYQKPNCTVLAPRDDVYQQTRA